MALLLALTTTAPALAQDPGTSAGTEGGGASASSSPPSTGKVAPTTSTSPAGAQRRRKEKARQKRERRKRERERRQAALLAQRTEAARKAGFAALLEVAVDRSEAVAAAALATVRVDDRADAGATGASRAAGAGVPGLAQAAARPSVRRASPWSTAAPALIGLLGAALLLLALAAVPASLADRSVFVSRALERRFEIGLLGTAVLASAAIGLVVSTFG